MGSPSASPALRGDHAQGFLDSVRRGRGGLERGPDPGLGRGGPVSSNAKSVILRGPGSALNEMIVLASMSTWERFCADLAVLSAVVSGDEKAAWLGSGKHDSSGGGAYLVRPPGPKDGAASDATVKGS